MILVDSSVWIDYFRGTKNQQTEKLDLLLDEVVELVGVADLVVFEVMRGFTSGRAHRKAQELLLSLEIVEIGGLDNALLAAEHYSELRARGYTVHSPVDVLLASFCITHDHMLLHRDTDFDVMQTLRGLTVWQH